MSEEVLKSDQPGLKVAILEDHRLLLDLLTKSLSDVPDIEVVASCASVSEAKELIDANAIDAALLDIELPDGNGIGFAVSLRRKNPNVGIVLLSAKNMLELVETLPQSERRGWCYLSKSSTVTSAAVAGVLRASTTGEAIIDPSLHATARDHSKLSKLTKRQFDVLRAVAEGLSNQAIADELSIAPNSVGNHLIGIYDALEIPEGRNARVAAVLEYLAAPPVDSNDA